MKKISRSALKILLGLLGILVVKGLYVTFDNKEVVYSLFDQRLGGLYSFRGGNEELNSWDGVSPPLMQSPKYVYRYADGYVRYKTDNGRSGAFDNPGCLAYDSKHWEYRYVDQSDFNRDDKFTRIVSVENGKYKEFNSNWSIDKTVKVDRIVDVTWLEYVTVGCQWDFYSSFWNGIFICPIRIFIQ